jgi:AraC family transcriptional regulator
MALQPVPVTQGSPNFRELPIEAGSLIHAWFPPGITIEMHTHDHPIFAVMLRGSFDLHFSRQSHVCQPTTVLIEPAGEPHGNHVHPGGADVLVLQPDPSHGDHWRLFAPLFDEPRCLQHAGIAGVAARTAREMVLADAFTPLATESLALEMLVAAARIPASSSRTTAIPAWLLRVTEMLREQPVASLRIRDLAREVDVHPARLVRTFRRHYHTSIGKYAREVRLEWAASRLERSNDTIAAVAAKAGFADQSHLTRAVKQAFGLTPRQIRVRHELLMHERPPSDESLRQPPAMSQLLPANSALAVPR